MFSIVFDEELVDSFLPRLVLDADGTIAVVLDDGLVDATAGHLYFRWNNKRLQFIKSTNLFFVGKLDTIIILFH